MELNYINHDDIGYGLFPFWNLNDTLYQKKYPADIIFKINENRQSVLGSSYESFVMKSEFLVANDPNAGCFKMDTGRMLKMKGLSKKMVNSFVKSDFLNLIDTDPNHKRE